MRVLVTGAMGFLGSHLSMRHLKQGDTVVGVDDFSSSDDNSEHAFELQQHPNFTLINEDVRTDGGWWDRKFDLLYNFACPASPPVYQQSPVATLMTCTGGTNNVLMVAMNSGGIVVHASTSEVYGDPNVSPQPETYRGHVNSYGPRACYDEGKRAAEALCFDYRNTYGVDARLVRIFNTYGPHMDIDDGRVVTNFIRQALAGEKLTVYGDGKQTRSFCYVDDLIDGIVKLGQLPTNPGTPINLGNPTEHTMLELADAVIDEVRALGSGFIRESMLDFRVLPTDDPTQRRPDITLARELLGWEPKVSLAEGLAKTVAYFRRGSVTDG